MEAMSMTGSGALELNKCSILNCTRSIEENGVTKERKQNLRSLYGEDLSVHFCYYIYHIFQCIRWLSLLFNLKKRKYFTPKTEDIFIYLLLVSNLNIPAIYYTSEERGDFWKDKI